VQEFFDTCLDQAVRHLELIRSALIWSLKNRRKLSEILIQKVFCIFVEGITSYFRRSLFTYAAQAIDLTCQVANNRPGNAEATIKLSGHSDVFVSDRNVVDRFFIRSYNISTTVELKNFMCAMHQEGLCDKAKDQLLGQLLTILKMLSVRNVISGVLTDFSSIVIALACSDNKFYVSSLVSESKHYVLCLLFSLFTQEEKKLRDVIHSQEGETIPIDADDVPSSSPQQQPISRLDASMEFKDEEPSRNNRSMRRKSTGRGSRRPLAPRILTIDLKAEEREEDRKANIRELLIFDGIRHGYNYMCKENLEKSVKVL
jgi:hypothetical protein